MAIGNIAALAGAAVGAWHGAKAGYRYGANAAQPEHIADLKPIFEALAEGEGFEEALASYVKKYGGNEKVIADLKKAESALREMA